MHLLSTTMIFEKPSISATIVFLMAASIEAAAEDYSGDPVAGMDLVERWCIDCHETGAGMHGGGALGAPAFQDVADDPSVTELALRAFLQTPHYEMPNLMLSPVETDDVISYILKLRTR